MKHKSSLLRASLFVPTLVLGAVITTPLPAWSQDQGVAVQPMNPGQRMEDFLNNQLPREVPQDFEGAIASTKQFLAANPDLDHWGQMRVVGRAGSLLYSATPETKRAAVVAPTLQFLDDEIAAAKVRDAGDVDFLAWEIRELSSSKVKILLAEKRAPEAIKVLELWHTMRPGFQNDINLDDSFTWGENWRAAQNQQKQPDQAVSGLVKDFETGLVQRDTFARGTVTNIVAELLAQDKSQEALSWAKLEFSLCRFDEGAIRDATKDVNRCLSAGELTLAKANQFAAAQTDSAAPNPLDKVPLPQFDTTEVRAQLAVADDKSPFEGRLLRRLAVGDYRNAMLMAKSQLVGDVTNQDNALQVARVFKAKDGDILRANQFLAYYQMGQGDNPIPAFLKETEATPEAG